MFISHNKPEAQRLSMLGEVDPHIVFKESKPGSLPTEEGHTDSAGSNELWAICLACLGIKAHISSSPSHN